MGAANHILNRLLMQTAKPPATGTGENNRVLFFWYLILQSVELAVFFKEGTLGISLLRPSVVLMIGLLFIAMFFLMVRSPDTPHAVAELSRAVTRGRSQV